MPKGYTQETFEKRVKEVHGDRIDVSNFKYINSITSGEARCNICGNVWHPRADVLIRGCGCRKCYDKKNSERKTIPFKEIQYKISGITLHEDDYIDTKHKCTSTCNICGYTWRPLVRDLMNGHGCPECVRHKESERTKNKRLENTLKIIKEVHGDIYDLSLLKTEFKSDRNYVHVICKKHGVFKVKLASFKNGCGCSKCNQSKLEKNVMNSLNENNIENIPQYSFNWMKTSLCGKLSYDFLIPNINLAIECQGRQHFEPVDAFGGKKELINTIKRDKKKMFLSEQNGVKLIYFLDEKYNKYMNEGDVYFNNVDDLIKYIKDYEIRTT
jgi:hypothetical protein